MGEVNRFHRPLSSGLRILAERFDGWGRGTLTGVAYRDDVEGDNRVLVACGVQARKDRSAREF